MIQTAGVIVIANNKVLLIKHKEQKGQVGHKAGTYGIPAGGLDNSETPKEAAVRELFEETGIELKEIDLTSFTNNQYTAEIERSDGTKRMFSAIYFLSTVFSIKIRETSEGRPFWCSIDKLNDYDLLPNNKEAIRNAVEFLNNPRISIIAAIGKNRELGYKNQLLWHIPEDLKRFRKLTEGHVVVMGRKTYESIGKPLPNRTNIIISRSLENMGSKDVVVVSSLEEALSRAKALEKRGEVFIIGGGQVYSQALRYADWLYLTKVNKEAKADTYFPEYEHIFIKIVNKERGEFNGNLFEYLTLEKAR